MMRSPCTTTRVSFALCNQRKPEHSHKDPAEPKINKQIIKKKINLTFLNLKILIQSTLVSEKIKKQITVEADWYPFGN